MELVASRKGKKMNTENSPAEGIDWLKLFRQSVRFGLVGASGLVVNMGVAVAMNKMNGGTQNANDVMFDVPGLDLAFRFTSFVWIGAFVIANLWNYQLNRRWTFKGHKRGWWSGLGPFMGIGAVAAFLGMWLKHLFMKDGSWIYLDWSWLDDASGLRSREYWSQLITIFVTMPINFVVNKIWTFGGKHAAS